jgi:hypothetical protein
MSKKLWLGFVAVFVTAEILNYVIMDLILGPSFGSLKSLWREDMMSKMWIYHVIMLVGAFFFTYIFSKGYEGKGIMEGVRYGLYIGIWMSIGAAYGTYAMIAIPYYLTLEWFLLGVLDYIIMGIVVALVYGTKKKVAEVKS